MKRSVNTPILIVFVIITLLAFPALACQVVSAIPSAISTPKVIQPISTPTSFVSPPTSPDLTSMQDTLVYLYQEVNPGVVAIRVLTQQGSGLGSGFVFDKEGHIITNFHVIENEADLEIDFPSGFKTRGTVIATDLDSDLAILKVVAPVEELHPLRLGDSSQIKVGQTVVAIGNPFGLSGTMTVGIISAIGRTLESMRTSPTGGQFTAGDMIQTDTAINPGNSGGPLLNLNGEVIGVNRAIRTYNFTNDQSQEPLNSGVGFAISINIVKRVAPLLITNGKYDYPYLGITSINDLSLLQQEALNLPRSTGAYVIEVSPNTPADLAGIVGGSQPTDYPGLNGGGDLIIAIDGVEVRQFADLLSYLVNYQTPGEVVVLTIVRDGKEIQVNLTLGKRP